jgi:hypothetical protein
MKTFTIQDIRSWEPCYDPSKFLKEGWKGTAIEILNNENIPFDDRFWCVLRHELMSEKAMRLFIVWCYRQTLKFIDNPDPRSVQAVDIAERFAKNEATVKELSLAWVDADIALNTAKVIYRDMVTMDPAKFSRVDMRTALMVAHSSTIAVWAAWVKSGVASYVDAPFGYIVSIEYFLDDITRKFPLVKSDVRSTHQTMQKNKLIEMIEADQI